MTLRTLNLTYNSYVGSSSKREMEAHAECSPLGAREWPRARGISTGGFTGKYVPTPPCLWIIIAQ